LGVAQRQLDQFTDLSHLLAATTNIIVANLVEVTLLILSLDGLTLAVNNCVLGNNAVLWGVDLHDLKLDLSHTTSYCEQVTLADWSVCLTEVRSEVDIEEGAGQTLNGIGNGKDSNALGLFAKTKSASNQRERGACSSTYIFDIGAGVDSDDVAVLDTEVVAHNTVDTGAPVIKIVIGQDDQHCVLTLLTLHQDCVSTEELESLHGVVREGNNRVIIVNGIGHTENR
jgi:hypothetical protein